MKKLFYFFLTGLLLSGNILADLPSTWEKTGEANDIFTFQKNDGSELLQVKGVIIINRGIDIMGNMLRDIHNHVRWVNYCDEAKILKKINRNHYIFYETMTPPWPVDKRDMVLESKSEYFNDKLMVEIKSWAIPYDKYPSPENTVRIKLLEVKLKLEYITRNKTGLTYEIKVDPSGDIPSFLSNIFNQMYVYQNLDSLRLAAQDESYISSLTDDMDTKLVNKLISKEKVMQHAFKTRLERILNSGDNIKHIVNDSEIYQNWLDNKDGFAEGLFWADHDKIKREENLKKLMSLYLKRFQLSKEEILFLSNTDKMKLVFLKNNLEKDLNIELIKNILTGKS